MADITVNLFDIVKTKDLSKTQSVIGDPDSYANINQLSEYFLTDNILYECQWAPNNQNYSNRMSYFDGYGGGSGGANGELVSWQGSPYRYQRTGCAIFIPINKFNISAITVKTRFNAFCGWANSSSGLEWNQFKLKFARVNPEGMVFSNQILYGNYSTFSSGSYVTLTGSASPAFEADYIVINVYDGAYQFTDVEITGTPVIEYNWQSVPSISGKNGILSLVTLDSESVNDGEPVSGAAVSVFDQNPVSGNNVKDIVDGNTPLIPSAVDVTAAFIISNPPVGELASRILAAKKDSIPESIEDADKTVSIPANASNVTMPGLDENSQYYFAIFVADSSGDTAVSDPKDIYTSGDEGWTFDYTGEIQTFVAPKTGIYQLETWGAQGGDATDGTLTARGGYGAYAVGEVFLTHGETLYINVGGQNGYGGGGLLDPVPEEYAYIKNLNSLYSKDYADSSNIVNFFEVSDYYNGGLQYPMTPVDDLKKFSYTLGYDASTMHTENSNATVQFLVKVSSTIMNIRVITGENTVSVSYENETLIDPKAFFSNTSYLSPNIATKWNYLGVYNGTTYNGYMVGDISGGLNYYQDTFIDLDTALKYIMAHYCNVNLYVDDVLWVSALT